MTPERWQQLNQLFHAALERAPHERPGFLAASGADPRLAADVAALIEAHEHAGTFLDQPAPIDPADLHADPSSVVATPPDTGAAHPQLAIGTQVGSYEILGELGRGGMGVVYLARDARLGRRVALKMLPDHASDNDTLRERLRREARAAATISHHGVATVYALEEIDGQMFIASEYVPGTTLRTVIASGPLSAERASAIAMAIAAALAAAHDAGVIHRDLKPENVLITADGAVKVVDFGIAHIDQDGATRLTRDGGLLGTPGYMAPEQLLGGTVDARTDLYALGVILEEMTTGTRREFGATAIPAGVVGQLREVVTRCTEIIPARRPSSARTVMELLSSGPGTPPAADGLDRARWWWQFHQVATTLVYWLTLFPAWRARELIGDTTADEYARVLFLITLGAIIVSTTLRLHLWFTLRFNLSHFAAVHATVRRPIAIGDWVFTLSLVLAALLISRDRSPTSFVLFGVAIGAAIAFVLIEPTTTRAAFGERLNDPDGGVGTHHGP